MTTKLHIGKVCDIDEAFVPLIDEANAKQAHRERCRAASRGKPPAAYWVASTLSFMVAARTKSEARAELKRRCGIGRKGRLPVGYEVRRIV